MDFARKEMEKYGWKEGKGLGKDEVGIVTALKPQLKFDNAGVGAKPGEEFTNEWWKDVYDRAAQNLEVTQVDGEVKLGLKSGKNTEVTTTPASVIALKKHNTLEYGTFLKTSKLTEEGMQDYRVKGKDKEKNLKPKPTPLTDDEVFKACGGRTVNQASRFGIYMSGKLSRLERQEKMLLKKMKNVSLNDNPIIEKKVKKIKEGKTSKKAIVETPKEVLTSPLKKKKKKKGSVSFNETVTEYYPVHEECDSESPQRDAECDSPLLHSTKSSKDEGIEADFIDTASCESKSLANIVDVSKQSLPEEGSSRPKLAVKKHNVSRNTYAGLRWYIENKDPLFTPYDILRLKSVVDSYQPESFGNVDDVSKDERRKLKKKREKRNRCGGATAQFLADFETEMNMVSTKLIEINNMLEKDNPHRCKKRKLPSDDYNEENRQTNKPGGELDLELVNLKHKLKKHYNTEKRLKNVMKSMDVWKITD